MSVTLTYFTVRARGELSRMVMAAAKKDFKEVKVEFADWPKVKPTTPFGVLPVLEVKGQSYAQGMAIATYLARENGLYGSDNLECLMIDQIVQFREDLMTEETKYMFTSTDEEKQEILKKLNETTYPRLFDIFTKCIQANPTKSGFVVGKKLTLADITIHEATQSISQRDPTYLDKYPELKAIRAKVEAHDGLKQYLAKRAETPI